MEEFSKSRGQKIIQQQQRRKTEDVELFKNKIRRRQKGFIVGYNLYLMTSEDIINLAACKDIKTPEQCLSLKMGPSEENASPCETCGNTLYGCIGHWGYIQLNVLIPNPMFIKEIVYILRLFDYNKWVNEEINNNKKRLHGEETTPNLPDPLFDSNIIYPSNLKGVNKMKMILDAPSTQDKSVHNDSQIKYKYTIDSPVIIMDIKYKNQIPQSIPVNLADVKKFFQALQINKNILTGETWVQTIGLGDTKIEALIVEYIPVLPNTTRLTAHADDSKREDYLTLLYKEIVSVNKSLTEEERKNAKTVEKVATDVYTSYRNLLLRKDDIEQIGTKSIVVVKSIVVRMDGKYGRMRGTVLGKRSDFSARTVLTGNPDIPMDYIGVPYEFAEKVTVPDVINNNEKLDEINRLIANGHVLQIKRNGINYKINRNYMAQLGDIAERKLQDHDPVIFSRQPVLHKGSIMCYKAKVLRPDEGNVFQLNLAVTTPHNADFDGDEGNVAVPQNIYSRAEIIEKMLSTKCIRGDASSAPLIGLVQDGIIGAERLTQSGVIVDIDTYTKGGLLIGRTKEEIDDHLIKCKKNGLVPRSGRAFFSMLLPKNFYFFKKIKIKQDKFNVVEIKNGLLLSGILDAQTLGRKSGSIIDALYLSNGYGDKTGPETAADFLTKVQWLVGLWLRDTGFSIGYDDCILPNNAENDIKKMIENAKLMAAQLQEKEIYDESGAKILEQNLQRIFETLKGNVLKYMRNSKSVVNNKLLQMINSGAKGAPFNAVEIMGVLGQQQIEGGRIPFEFDNKSRITPHFTAYSKDPLARGFCGSSYARGLSQLEYWMHAKATRPNLIETNLSPADTGYFFRRLSVMMEDMISYEDQSIRDENGRIVQFLYGDDGFDPQLMSSADGKFQLINIQSVINDILSEELATT